MYSTNAWRCHPPWCLLSQRDVASPVHHHRRFPRRNNQRAHLRGVNPLCPPPAMSHELIARDRGYAPLHTPTGPTDEAKLAHDAWALTDNQNAASPGAPTSPKSSLPARMLPGRNENQPSVQGRVHHSVQHRASGFSVLFSMFDRRCHLWRGDSTALAIRISGCG